MRLCVWGGEVRRGEGAVTRRYDFMISHHGIYLAKLRCELENPGSAVRCAIDRAVEPGR